MRKLLLTLVAMLTLASAQADEGMWTLYDLPQAVYDKMREEGLQMPYADLYQSSGAIKNCVVNFSGYCTGVVVSPDGLVFTNHHCGFESIRSHSTVEHDYMLDGFVARSYEEELPNEHMFVSFMVSQQRVTDRLRAAGIDSLDHDAQEMLVDSLQQAMTDSIHAAGEPTLRVSIDPFYEGNEYYATVYQDFNDLRLVFAIPKSMGKFGGETDNWMWPRQTCDFSVFRIYADPDTNGPADYSERNVPYHPASWAPVSMDGYQDGDYAMTIGYPGSTSRYLSSYGIREMRDAKNAPMAQVRGVKQDIMLRHMQASEAVRIKYDSKYAQSSNYWKNALGMNKCIDSIGIVNQKRDYEARLRQWQDSTGFLRGQLDMDQLGRLYEQRLDMVRRATYWGETFLRTNEFCTRALALSNGMELKGSAKRARAQYVEFEDNSDTWDEALDKEVFAALLDNYAQHVEEPYLPAFYATIRQQFGGDYRRYVDDLYARSQLMRKGQRIYVNRKSYLKDPGVQFSLDLTEILAALVEELMPLTDSIDVQERYLCAAKLRMEEDMPHYSDANFTMRLSYGQVGGYELGGRPSGYYTTAESMVEKMDRAHEVAEYEAEPLMRELLSTPDFGPYADRRTGKMQLCFLTNNDITGGNSGSPMFDGKGRLIGLAFDGNWDSLSSDINFDHRLARCIGVDIRYVLFMMDRWGHADRLLRELGMKVEAPNSL